MRLLALSTSILALLVAAPVAAAHDLTVAKPGSVELDLGTVSIARLVHATLLDAGDTVELTLQAQADSPLDLFVLLPDNGPEAGPRAGDEPRTSLVQGAVRERIEVDRSPQVVEDEVTGLRYRIIGHTVIDEDGTYRVVVARGAVPTRVAVRVASTDADFVTEDPRRTPRALLAARAWNESPAPGSRPVTVDPGREGKDERINIWIPLSFGVLAVLLAAWWLHSGWRTARRRGVERSIREDR